MIQKLSDEEIEAANKAIETFQSRLPDLVNGLHDVLDPLVVTLGDLVGQVVNVFRQQYINIGSPYGETEEGFLQWLEELNEHSAQAI